MLYIVATPIGNLEDITLRAIRTLKEADYIAAEDTRHSKILLKKHNINTPTISFHSYSNEKKLEQILQLMRDGKEIALISDAGTPGISDPGYKLIKTAREEGIKVVPIPGPSAFLAALSASGLPTHQFLYLGFLPMKKGRQKLLDSLVKEPRTLVFYESPHRILKTLKELETHFGERPLVIARELTKIHEEYFSGTAAEAFEHFSGGGGGEPGSSKSKSPTKKPKGEFVVLIASI